LLIVCNYVEVVIEKKLQIGCTVNVQIELKKICNSMIEVSTFCYLILNIDFNFKNDQLEIDYLRNFF